MSLTLWKDRELSRLRRDMDSLFETFCRDFSMSCTMEQLLGPPRVDLSETEDELIVQADIPGLNEKGLHLSIDDDVLVIQGKREERVSHEGGEAFHSTSFTQHVPLPVPVLVDQVSASFQDGHLTVRLPKKEEPPRRIAISVGPAPAKSSS